MPETKLPDVKGLNPGPKRQINFRQRFASSFSLAGLIAAAIICASLLNILVFQPYSVEGSSMEPTLSNGDRLIVLKLGKTFASISGGDFIPKRGDIVVFERNDSSQTQLIKRVIGLPGERVVVKDGAITVYNEDSPAGFNPDTEFQADLEITSGVTDTVVGAREVFVVGDNRVPGASLDSRSSLGNVSVDQLVGTLALRFFPFSSLKGF